MTGWRIWWEERVGSRMGGPRGQAAGLLWDVGRSCCERGCALETAVVLNSDTARRCVGVQCQRARPVLSVGPRLVSGPQSAWHQPTTHSATPQSHRPSSRRPVPAQVIHSQMGTLYEEPCVMAIKISVSLRRPGLGQGLEGASRKWIWVWA